MTKNRGFQCHSKVHECKPKLGNLLTILESSSFKGKEYESIIDPESLYDWHKLQNEVQASEDELFEALPKYLIVNINGMIIIGKIISRIETHVIRQFCYFLRILQTYIIRS